MELTTETTDGTTEIALSGELTYEDTDQFDSLLNDLERGQSNACIVRFNDLQMIDSSGLRMLLLLHDVAKKKKMNLEFAGAHGDVRERIEFARFQTIVTVRD